MSIKLTSKLNKKAFTLIEVVLVLAIGGLLFLLAFLAFSQVQANRRDTQRRTDATRVFAELQNYYGDKRTYPDNSGNITPGTNICSAGSASYFRTFVADYVCTSGQFKSPSGVDYGTRNNTDPELPVDRIRFLQDRSCADDTARPGIVRLEMGLERGGIFCRDTATTS